MSWSRWRWLCFLTALSALTAARAAPLSPALTLEADLQVLRVARTLAFSAEQVAAVLPLHEKAQQLAAQQRKSIDELWASAQGPVNQVLTAWIAGQQPERTVKKTADQAADAYQELVAAQDKELDALLRQVGRLLTPRQLALVTSAREADQQSNNRRRYQGATSLAEYMAHEIAVLRRLLPPEYDTLRVAVAMRLAALIVTPEDRAFADAVNRLLQLEDTVRRMTEPQFASNEERLPDAVAQALNLPPRARRNDRPLTEDDLRSLLTYPNAAALLKSFRPAGAAGGDAQ